MPLIIRKLDKRTGITYVYERTSYRDAENGAQRFHWKLLGKVDPETGETVPTGRPGRPAGSRNRNKSDFRAVAVRSSDASGTGSNRSGPGEKTQIIYLNQKCRVCFMNRRAVIGTWPYNLIDAVEEVLAENEEAAAADVSSGYDAGSGISGSVRLSEGAGNNKENGIRQENYNSSIDSQSVRGREGGSGVTGMHRHIPIPLTKDQEAGLETALKMIPEKEQNCALGFYKDGLSVGAVAKQYGLTYQKVQSAIDRAVRRLAHPALLCRIQYGDEGCMRPEVRDRL